ncbi:acyl-CoA thioesterase [Aquabacter spiritensis]|nr:thioesterase family protein [Aquabacter spiritensis]
MDDATEADVVREQVLEDFPLRAFDKLRYADTDRQGHINNAVFSTFLETGRAEILYSRERGIREPGCAFVIARLLLEFRAEVNWPGEVWIGTRVAAIGTSSLKLEQAIFQDGRRVANAETVIVQIDEATRRSRALSEAASEKLAALLAPPAS